MKVHFVGIGGIGVSALAQYYLDKGHQVSGSDLVHSETTEALKKKRAQIFIGSHLAKNLDTNVDEVIYSPAVKSDNPELKKAKKLGIKCLSYPQALGELTQKYFTIAVCGTHGKSTTTSMLALILIRAGLDPTVIVGTKLREFSNYNTFSTAVEKVLWKDGSNFRMGKSRFLVVEACEYESAFLNYWPKIIIITNIEKEHLDYYKNLDNIIRAFKKFVGHLPKDGVLVANKDDPNSLRLLKPKSQTKKINFFSIKQREAKKLKRILKIPGEHNIYNALAALAAARVLKIPDRISFKALSEYKGSWRRFEVEDLKIENCKLKIIQDYAHHPTEIKATLLLAREQFRRRKIWCVFQPHQYQRTHYLFNDFVRVFSDAFNQKWIDKLIITDIYDVAGREDASIKKEVNSKKLVDCCLTKLSKKFIEKIIYISDIEKAANFLKRNLKGREVVIIMGAGDIYNLNSKLVQPLT